MSADNQEHQDRITENDLILAEAYFKILVQVARARTTIFYSELVAKAKEAFPENSTVQNAIATSAGRKLNVVRMFTNEKGLPDLSSLVINKSSNECGEGFLKNFSPEEIRASVFKYPWEAVDTGFSDFIVASKELMKPKKRKIKKKLPTGSEAAQMMADYYQANKSAYPKSIREHRDEIIKLIMDGLEVEKAFETFHSPSVA